MQRAASGSAVSTRLPLLASRTKRSGSLARRHVLCKCGKHGPSDPSDADFKPVFEMLPPRGIVTLSDARDAFECCKGLSGVARTACYNQFGADPDKVERYLWLVEEMEETLRKGEEMVFQVCVDMQFFRQIRRVTPKGEAQQGEARQHGGA